jgi:hypothetical protein
MHHEMNRMLGIGAIEKTRTFFSRALENGDGLKPSFNHKQIGTGEKLLFYSTVTPLPTPEPGSNIENPFAGVPY